MQLHNIEIKIQHETVVLAFFLELLSLLYCKAHLCCTHRLAVLVFFGASSVHPLGHMLVHEEMQFGLGTEEVWMPEYLISGCVWILCSAVG